MIIITKKKEKIRNYQRFNDFEKVQDMRYGENPHQKAAFYREIGKSRVHLPGGSQLNGKELSFNNINDTNGP